MELEPVPRVTCHVIRSRRSWPERRSSSLRLRRARLTSESCSCGGGSCYPGDNLGRGCARLHRGSFLAHKDETNAKILNAIDRGPAPDRTLQEPIVRCVRFECTYCCHVLEPGAQQRLAAHFGGALGESLYSGIFFTEARGIYIPQYSLTCKSATHQSSAQTFIMLSAAPSCAPPAAAIFSRRRRRLAT